jgi:hypothetical protein
MLKPDAPADPNPDAMDEPTLIDDPVKSDFSGLVGKWESDIGFDEVIASQRRIDADKWK